MNRNSLIGFGLLAISLCLATPLAGRAQFAVEVISYNQGATPSPGGYTAPSSALGEPERITGDGGPFPFPGIVSPFSPPYLTNEIVSIGQGGQITLRLSHFAIAQPTGLPEIGVFTNVGTADLDFNNVADTPAAPFSKLDIANVEVSADGITWHNLGIKVFDNPTNSYTDLTDPYNATPGTSPSDYRKPFLGSLSDFGGLDYPGMVTLLNGSGGGKWIDISNSGLSQVGYIRFSRDDSSDSHFSLNFDLDAVMISQVAKGLATVPEPTTLTGVIVAIGLATSRRRRRRSQILA